jgi:hypothetical protein
MCVCVVELQVTFSYITILNRAQQCFYGKFISPATMKRTWVLVQNVWCRTETEEYLLFHALLYN